MPLQCLDSSVYHQSDKPYLSLLSPDKQYDQRQYSSDQPLNYPSDHQEDQRLHLMPATESVDLLHSNNQDMELEC